MALPTSRNTNYVAGVSMVLAADLNDVQDKIVDLNSGKRTVADTLFIHPCAGDGTFDGGLSGQGIHSTIGTIQGWFFPVSLPVGSRITQIDVYVNGDTLKTVTAELSYVDVATATVTDLGSPQTSALANTFQTLTQAALNHTVATGRSYFVELQTSAAAPAGTIACYGVRVTYDRP
jgi:hypothetical protein